MVSFLQELSNLQSNVYTKYDKLHSRDTMSIVSHDFTEPSIDVKKEINCLPQV